MEKKSFRSVQSLPLTNQETGDDCNTAAPSSLPPRSLSAMQPKAFNTFTYDELLDNDALYSVYSPRRSNTPGAVPLSFSRALEPEPMNTKTMQTKSFEALIEKNSINSTYPRSSNPVLLGHQNYYAQLMPSELDMEVHAAMLAQQLHRSHIVDWYARVQDSLPTMAYNSVTGFDPYNSRIPINQYQLGLRHDHHGGMQQNTSFSCSKFPRNPNYQRNHNFAGDTVTKNPRSSMFNQNLVVTPKLDYEGNKNCVLLDTLWDTGDVFEIMKSKYGNYTFQNILRLSDEEQMKDIVYKISKDPKRLVEVATDEFGRISFKKLIAAVRTLPSLCEHLMFALSPELLGLMTKPKSGPSVIEYLLNDLSADHNWPIYKVALENFSILSMDQTGVFSLKHCINNFTKFDGQEFAATSYKWLLLMKLIENSVELATNTYGNFVVQHVIDLQIGEYTSLICNKLKDNVHQLALNKYGSFVLQRCLNSSGCKLILQVLLTSEAQILKEITMHPYGNYVMQTAMKVLKELPLSDELVQATQQFPEEFKSFLNTRNGVNYK